MDNLRRIAVLDDDEHWCSILQRHLRKDFSVAVYTDVQSFLRNKDQFDLIVVDFTLLPSSEFEAVTNGCQLIAYLKQTLQHPPIAVLTSGYIYQNDLEDSELDPLCAEADLFLTKNTGLDTLLQQLQQLLVNKTSY
jgi:CheY-like chemotaxis protein